MGSQPKYSEVWFPYIQLKAFCIIEHTIYIFPTLLRPSFKLLLKSRNLKDLTISPNVHSTDTRTRLIDLLYLYESIAAVSLASMNGAY